MSLTDAKIGDKLCIVSNLSPNRLAVVDRITPSGRLITKSGTFTPNGRLYGGHQDTWISVRARLATEDDIAGIYRYRLVREIETFQGWDKLTVGDLQTVADIVKAHQTDRR